jgi:L-ascorbate metabolism protein UlaG (beta-lactamase superfamily)
MPIELTWYGHAVWLVSTDQHKLVIDPFFNESPTAPIKADEVSADFILVSHGHFDHIADAASIALRTGATVISNYEIANWLSNKFQVASTVGMNVGGQASQPFGVVKMTQAIHSSQLPDGTFGGIAAGFLLTLGGRKLYFACDTALFTDMQVIGQGPLDVAVVPIGDLFTMGPEDSVQAVQWLAPRWVLPSHYNTWPPIHQDAESWADMIRRSTSAEPVVLKPGQSFRLPN